jgi:hypothetical protein
MAEAKNKKRKRKPPVIPSEPLLEVVEYTDEAYDHAYVFTLLLHGACPSINREATFEILLYAFTTGLSDENAPTYGRRIALTGAEVGKWGTH